MALIKCFECGNMVSDKASGCIHCGAPLIVDKSVKIKIPRFDTGIALPRASEAEIQCNGKVLWKGFSGEVASIEIETESLNLKIIIKRAYTGHPFPFFRDFNVEGDVGRGKRYEVKNKKGALFKDPTKSVWMLSEVDVIDSGL